MLGPAKAKTTPARRRPRADLKPFAGRLGHTAMTLEVQLHMPPVRALLRTNGFDCDAIPEREFKIAVDIWRRDRIARGQWRVEWQSDGEAFMLAYAQSHHWDDEEVIERMNREKIQRKPGDLTDAERDSMTMEKYFAWTSKDID